MTSSIALCTYNGEKYIRNQVSSYINQTVLPDEIVICDDGSTDNTLKIIHNVAQAKPEIRWRVIQNEVKLGTNKNFEKALGFCNGDIIFFSDQDDIWTSDKVAQTISFFGENPGYEASFSNAVLIDDQDEELPNCLLDLTFFKSDMRLKYSEDDLLYWSILLGNVMTGATMAIKRSAIGKVVPFQLNLGRKLWYDGWIGFCLMAGNSIGFIDQFLTKYRVHAGQQVGVEMIEDPFERHIMQGEYQKELVKEYFQKYLTAFSTLQNLKRVLQIPARIEDRITKEYLIHRRKYFETQSFLERKLRLLKWHLQGANYISLRDLVTL